MSETLPRLWSDFDGTAVALAKKTNPRNWSKYPLPIMAGYADFLAGVSSAGIEIAGVVSRRPNIYVRRLATARSIKQLGLSEFFPSPEQIVHKGSEIEKGRFVAEQSKDSTVGMLEDKPHNLGKVLLGVMRGSDYPVFPHYPVILGAVSHPRSNEYIERLAQYADCLGDNTGVSVEEVPAEAGVGLKLRSESLSIDVVQLEPYSEAAGISFGQRLVDVAN